MPLTTHYNARVQAARAPIPAMLSQSALAALACNPNVGETTRALARTLLADPVRGQRAATQAALRPALDSIAEMIRRGRA